MATVAAYPTPSNSGPAINKQINPPPEYKTIRHRFEDGGADVNVQPCGPRRWILEYDGLSVSDAGILDDHFETAKGKTNDFSFFDARAGETITGVRYEQYEVNRHVKYWSLSRRITLVAEA